MTEVTQQVETTGVRMILDVEYVPNGVSIEELRSRLQEMCERAIGEGMLTGGTEAEVDTWSAKTVVLPQPMDEDELADFMLERIEDGQLAVEDIPVRLARYGLMEPADFVTEMRERMESRGDHDE